MIPCKRTNNVKLQSLLLLTLLAGPAAAMDIPANWTAPVEPFRVVGNVYYIGTADVEQKGAARRAGAKENPFIAPGEYLDFVESSRKAFERSLANQTQPAK